MVTGLVLAVLLAFAGVHVPTLDDAAPAPLASRPSLQTGSPRTPAASATTVDFPGSAAPIVTPQPVASEPETPTAAPSGPITFAKVRSPGAPGGVAIGRDGHVYVTTDNGTARGESGPSKVFEFDRSGRQAGEVTIAGQPEAHATGLVAAAVDPTDGSLFVIDSSRESIIRIDPASGIQSIEATIPNAPPCASALNQAPCEPGFVDHQPTPSALAFGPRGDLLIADAGQATIWRWHTGDTSLAQWYSSLDLATGDGPAGLAFDPLGRPLFTVGSALDTANPGGGGLYAIEMNADGSAGGRTLVAAFSSNERPGAVAVAPSGQTFVILRGPGTIVTVQDGTPATFSTRGGSIPLDGPAGLAVTGDRLLVTNQSTTNAADHWVVLSFPISTS
jgi:hypothetical protein